MMFLFHRVFSFSGSMSVKLLGTKSSGDLFRPRNMTPACHGTVRESPWDRPLGCLRYFFFSGKDVGRKTSIDLPSYLGEGKGGFGPILVDMYSAFSSGKVTLVIYIRSWYYRILGGNWRFVYSSFSMEHGHSQYAQHNSHQPNSMDTQNCHVSTSTNIPLL